MRGEGAQAFLDRLVVADVGQHLLEERELGFRSRAREAPACAISASSPTVFRATVLPPVFGPLMSRVRHSSSSASETGTTGLRLPAQHVFEQRMPRIFSTRRRAPSGLKRGMTQSKSQAKPALAKSSSSSASRPAAAWMDSACSAQPRRHLAQDAVDLAQLLLGEAHQLVVQVDGLERLDEQRVAAAAGAVDDAVDSALAARR